MTKDYTCRVVLDLSQADETLTLDLRGASRHGESLAIAIKRWLSILQKDGLAAPVGKESCGPDVRVIGRAISGKPLAQNNSDQVIGARGVIALLHLGSDLVVRLGNGLRDRNPSGIIAKRAERLNMSHFLEQQIVPSHRGALGASYGTKMASVDWLGANFCTGRESNLPIDGEGAENGYKDLTTRVPACANMQSISWSLMTRQHQRGFQNTLTEFRKLFLCPFRSAARLNKLCALLVVSVVTLASVAIAQISDVDDIHVQPRISSDAISKTTVEGALADTVHPHSPTIKTKVDLVLVPVTVTDPANRLVTGLDKENFELFEGKDRQELRNFSSEDAPISLGVIFDMSGSMSSKIERAREAVIQFFKTANPQDEFFLVTFADRPEEISDFTQSIDDLQGKLVFTVPKGRTALLDAIYLGVSKMREAKFPKKALLIISDGGDNHSRYTEGEIKSLVKEADVMIYSIGIYDHYFQTEEERLGPQLLGDVTELSGGRAFTIDNPNDLGDVATKIGIELRNQYVLGYRPKNPGHDGKWHKIKVKLLPPKGLPPLHVYAKTGYYASSQ
jgi:Ca-activated chloride channel homolog